MARFDIFDTIERLRQTGAPFSVATVMRTADATSAKAGTKAAVTRHGDVASLGISETDFVVVASQGNGDLVALGHALESAARRVSMVASRRKAEVLKSKLRATGILERRLQQLKSPAGLDLGTVDPHEIAHSVLAEIVAWRNGDATKQEERADDERLAKACPAPSGRPARSAGANRRRKEARGVSAKLRPEMLPTRKERRWN
jgi:xanthine/CO dehydrogenase XdhC/CoxF family maturation factor